jgi:hypothetical protein
VLGAHGFRIVATDDLAQAAAQHKVNLNTKEGALLAAAELKLSVVINGWTGIKRRQRVLRVLVRDGRDGSIIDSANFTGRTNAALARDVERRFWSELGRAVQLRQPGGLGRAPLEAAPARPRRQAPPIAEELPEPTPPPRPARCCRAPRRRRLSLSRRPRRPQIALAPTPPPPPPDVSAKAPPPPPPPVETAVAAAPPPTFALTIGPRLLFRQLTTAAIPTTRSRPFARAARRRRSASA